MNAKLLCAVGAAVGVAGVANAQNLTSTASAREAANPYIAPAGDTVYDNAYNGLGTYGSAAQDFEEAYDQYDIWVGDDVSTDVAYAELELTSVGFVQDQVGPGDPFLVMDFNAQFLTGLPNDPNSQVVLESGSFSFDGINAWTAIFDQEGAPCLAAGDYIFQFQAVNDFLTNKQTYFFQQTIIDGENNGFQWNPGGGFNLPNDFVQPITDANGLPTSPNTLITGTETDECEGGPTCIADCDGNESLNILDFVCFQSAFQDGDSSADCDGNGNLNILDFVCFQSAFQDGCP